MDVLMVSLSNHEDGAVIERIDDFRAAAKQ
jgi:hypothetical protein